MPNLSENYYLRKCFLERGQVPTQSLIKKKMKPPLAAVYFKSMNPKLKVLAGLEPPLKGGGNNWQVDPKELLEGGRAVLKPVSKRVLANLGHEGIQDYGEKIFRVHRKDMYREKTEALVKADLNSRIAIMDIATQEWKNLAEKASKNNTEHLFDTYTRYDHLYRMSLDKIESLFYEAAVAEIERTRNTALNLMQNKYADALKYQATNLYDEYTEKLKKEKARLKAEFVQNLEDCRTEMGDKIHDLNVDKHITVEKIRQFLKYRNLACQIYVAIKEREECIKHMEELKQKHRKEAKILAEDIVFKDFEFHLAKQKERRRQEFNKIWQKKVCRVVKRFQEFVSYCLKVLPEHAEFFINMEKLMLLQVNETLENPSAESIFLVVEGERPPTPVPQPMPFYLFCDTGYKAQVDQDLCPKRVTSSMSQMPAIIINKRCLYAACDNFEQFSGRIKDYMDANRADIKDEIIYEHFVPVKYTSSQQLLEIKLESSLLQVLQQEIAYMDTIPVKCTYCQIPWCSCTEKVLIQRTLSTPQSTASEPSEHSIISNLGSMELVHERDPKWESYFEYVEPKKCSCDKTAKKHLAEHFPAYMRKMKYGPPEIPNYEICSVKTLKKLVRAARKVTPVAVAAEVLPTYKDMGTQYEDVEFEELCTCFGDTEFMNLHEDSKVFDASPPAWANQSRIVGGDESPTFMTKRVSSFATARAYSLRNLVEGLPDLQEIFKKENCEFK